MARKKGQQFSKLGSHRSRKSRRKHSAPPEINEELMFDISDVPVGDRQPLAETVALRNYVVTTRLVGRTGAALHVEVGLTWVPTHRRNTVMNTLYNGIQRDIAHRQVTHNSATSRQSVRR